MEENNVNPNDALRSVANMDKPDSRTLLFFRDQETGETRSDALELHNNIISQYVLEDCVPEKVKAQFETAKNLYLYSWYVYRFYNVSELQVLATLEFALSERLDDEVVLSWFKENAPKWTMREPTLKPYLVYINAQGWVVNEEFSFWRNRA